jgi:hypothetical protein
MPQPNYADKCIKHIFKVLHDQFVNISHSEMKSFTGSCWFHLEKNFAKASQIRPEFGRKPQQASVEQDDEAKLRTLADPPCCPTESYDDLAVLVLYKFSRDLFNRGGDEVSLSLFFVFSILCFSISNLPFFLFPQMVEIRRIDLIHSVLETGLNTGCSQCELMGTNSDKSKKLSLGSKTSLRDKRGLHVIIEDRTDPIWSTHALLHRLITQHLPADYKLQIFLKKAPKAEISAVNIGTPAQACRILSRLVGLT